MKKLDYNLHKDIENLSLYIYDKSKPDTFNGWVELFPFENYKTGYYAKVFCKDKKIIIISKGTTFENFKDMQNNISMVRNKLPKQVNDADKLYNFIKHDSKYKNYEIIMGGHSLGGSISEIIAAKYGISAVTFNSYGPAGINNLNIKDTSHIINYGSLNDFIFRYNINNHLGQVKIIPDNDLSSNKENQFYYKRLYKKQNAIKNFHLIENLGDLENAIDLNSIQNYPMSNESMVLKVNLSYDNIIPHLATYKDNNGNEYTYLNDGNEITPEFLDSLSTKNRLIYNTEFNLATTDDKEIIDRYAKQYYNGESYTKEDLDNGVNSGDLIYVKSYTRSDG